jgi:hypothetical protein
MVTEIYIEKNKEGFYEVQIYKKTLNKSDLSVEDLGNETYETIDDLINKFLEPTLQTGGPYRIPHHKSLTNDEHLYIFTELNKRGIFRGWF